VSVHLEIGQDRRLRLEDLHLVAGSAFFLSRVMLTLGWSWWGEWGNYFLPDVQAVRATVTESDHPVTIEFMLQMRLERPRMTSNCSD
jgi:hypothetical protein